MRSIAVQETNSTADPLQNRCKLYVVSQDDILNLLRLQEDIRRIVEGKGKLRIRIPWIANMPEDARVSAVNYEYSLRAFAFRVHHASFPQRSPARWLPIVKADLRVRAVTVRCAKGIAMIEEPFLTAQSEAQQPA